MADLAEIEKSAREYVAATMTADGGAHDSVKASKLICQCLAQAARSTKEPQASVVAAVRGAMAGALLSGQNIPETAVKVLEALPGITLMTTAGPEAVMSWVMQGMAEMVHMVSPEVRLAIGAGIEEKFMGAGTVFEELCEKAPKKQA
jgi:hypothetical protein